MEEKIKKYFINNINQHIISAVLIALIVLFFKPNFGQFCLLLFGYFGFDILLKFFSGGNIIQKIRGGSNSTHIQVGGDLEIDSFSSLLEGHKKPKKSKWQERMEEMMIERKKSQHTQDELKKGFEQFKNIKSELREESYDNPYEREHIKSLIDDDPFDRIYKKYNKGNINMSGSSITVNGKTYKGSGSVSIVNGVVKINGKTVSDESESKNVNIIVQGDIRDLTIESNAKCYINGNVQGDVKSHNLECGNVGGNIKAHNVTARDVKGSIKAHNVTTR